MRQAPVAMNLADIRPTPKPSCRPGVTGRVDPRRRAARSAATPTAASSPHRPMTRRLRGPFLVPGVAGRRAAGRRLTPRSPRRRSAALATARNEPARTIRRLLTVRVSGAKAATVFVDGKELGRAPLCCTACARARTWSASSAEERQAVKSRTKKVESTPRTRRAKPAVVLIEL